MARVRKTSGTRAARGIVHDFATARAGAPTPDGVERADTTGIEAGDLAAALNAVEESPEVRAERIRALRQQIEQGEYNPDPREIAKKILERGL